MCSYCSNTAFPHATTYGLHLPKPPSTDSTLPLRGLPIAFACKREATSIKRKLLVPIAAGMVTH